MALKANALTTLTFCKDYLDIPALNTDEDSRIEFFINQASEMIERYCGRKLLAQAITEYHDGRNSDRILLKEYPVNSITSINIDCEWNFAPATLLDSTDYKLMSQSEVIYKSVFPRGNGNVEIKYNAGFTTIPSDLEGACVQLVDFLYMQRSDRRTGVTQKSKNQETVQFITDLPPVVKSLLEPYVRCDFAQNIAGINK